MRPPRSTAPLALLMGLCLLAACSRPEKSVVLRLAHTLDPTHPVHVAMQRMADSLAEYSQGRMRIDLYPSGQLGSERETIELLQLGAIDLAKTSVAPLEGFIPAMAVFGIPYLFRDDAHYWKVVEGEVGRELLGLGAHYRLKGLCFYDAGSRSFYTARRPIHSPADLAGLKIRVQNSRTAIQLIQAMGGAATPLAFGELYTALDQGVVDGAENNPPSLLSSRHYEVCKFFSLDEHTRVPDIVLVSRITWDRLTSQQRSWLEAAAADSVRFQRQLWAAETERTLDTLKAAGVQILRPDKTPFQESVRPLHASFKGTDVGRWMERIIEYP